MIDFGIVKPGATLYVPFSSFAGSTGASVTLTGLAVTDIEIYKDGSTTQRASDNGYTLLDTDGIDFDGITGIHGFSISLADNTTAGFYAAGSQYWVVVSSVTIDSQTVNFIACTFRIGHEDAVLNTTIATLSSQTSFTLTAGPAEDDALNGCIVCIHDVASAVQMGFAVVQDYTGSTKTVTLVAGTTFTAAATDNISFFPPALVPTTLGRTLDVASGGEAGVDWGNVANQSTSVNLSATTTNLVNTATTLTNAPSDSSGVTTLLTRIGGTITITSGRVNADVTHWNASTTPVTNITTVFNTGFATNYNTTIDMWNVNVENWNTTAVPAEHTAGYPIVTVKDGTGTGEINTNAGAIALVDLVTTTTTATNVTTVNGLAAGVITATSIASDAFTAAKFAADVATEIRSVASGTSDSGTTTTMVDAARTEADTDYWKGCYIVFTSGNIAGQARLITGFTPASDTITFSPATTQAVSTQTYEIWPAARVDMELIRGTVSPAAAGYVGIDWAFVGNPDATVVLENTTVGTVSGATVTGMGANVITAASIAADAGTELGTAVWASATRTLTAGTNIQLPSNGLANISAWSVAITGNITGNLSGSVGSVTNAVTITGDAATAGTRFLTMIELDGAVYRYTTNALEQAPSGALTVAAIWDEAIAGHLTAGSMGAALNAAGSAGDPWTTTLPGSYTGSQAGFKFGTLFATALNILHPYVGQDSSLELVIGDDYYAADNRNIQFTYGASPSLSGATVYLDIQTDTGEAFDEDNRTSTAGSASGTVTQLVTFDLPGTTTDDFEEGWRAYRVRAVLSNSHTVTLTRGRVNMLSRGNDAP